MRCMMQLLLRQNMKRLKEHYIHDSHTIPNSNQNFILMKNIYNYTLTGLLALGVSMLLFSCGAKTDKKAELETLKKERNGLNDKIRKLEAELKDSDKSPKKSITVQVESVSTKTFTHLIDVH